MHSKPAARAPLFFLLPNNVCSTARLAARPHALRPCARQPRGCHFNFLWRRVTLGLFLRRCVALGLLGRFRSHLRLTVGQLRDDCLLVLGSTALQHSRMVVQRLPGAGVSWKPIDKFKVDACPAFTVCYALLESGFLG